MAMKHPHYHIVANNDKCGSFVATDIAFDNIKQSLPKCCHAIADIYIAGNDKFHSNGMCAIAGNKMAMTRPMGLEIRNPLTINQSSQTNTYFSYVLKFSLLTFPNFFM